MENYDDYKNGLHDPNSPMNEKEEQEQLTIEEFIHDGKIEDALVELSCVRYEINRLKEYSRLIDNTYLKHRLTEIYQKL